MHDFSNTLRGVARQGWGFRFARGLGAVALTSSAASLSIATFAHAQFLPDPIPFKALPNPQQLCKTESINRIAGLPVPGVDPIPRPVHVYYYAGGLEKVPTTRLVLVLISFERLGRNFAEQTFRSSLDRLGYYVDGQLELKSCQFYSNSALVRSSWPHRLLVNSQTLHVYSYYHSSVVLDGPPGRAVDQPGRGKTPAGDRAPPRQAKQSKPNPAGDKAKQAASSGPKVPATAAGPPSAPPAADPPVTRDPETAPLNPVPEKGTSIAALPPAAPDGAGRPAEVQRKSLKRYPRPNYTERAEPLHGIEALLTTKQGAKRPVFAVEELQCGEDGNWLVGYAGLLEFAPGEDAKVLLTQRHALNNYPGQGVQTWEALRKVYAKDGGLECDAGGKECSGPAYMNESYAGHREALLAARASRTGVVSDPSRYSCRPDKGICISQEREHWRCNLEGNCLSYDPTRWWCAWRQEFCFSRVKFGDWASPIKQNDVIRLKLDGSAAELVYDMSDGFLRIAQDALTRICGPGETKVWKASWASPK